MSTAKDPVATAGMLIHKPLAEVFEAFVDPKITANFWFSEGTARLDAGKRVTWTWKMYGVSAEVGVIEIVPNQRIVMDWGDPGGSGKTRVVWAFEEKRGGSFVTVENSGFKGDDACAEAIGSTDGFALVLAGAKAWLEHGLRLNLVPDRHPDARVD
ncbi:MAG TPA: SRPBCC family protein [Rhizobiaceae bacterium]|nr:SRPBCC family protein [Rhizobiaceae bacterium]